MERDHAYFNNSMRLLKKLSIMADGDTEKFFDLKLLYEQFKNRISKEEFFEKILTYLQNKKWILKNAERVAITYDGIYEVSTEFDIPPTTLGILTKNDVIRMSPILMDFIIKNKEKNNNCFPIYMIENQFRALGKKAILQILKNLETKGVLKVSEDKIEIN